MDYDALAKKLGGAPASDKIDYDALAAQYGGAGTAPSKSDGVPSIPLVDVPGEAASSFFPSLGKYAGELYEAATNPMRTAEGLITAATGFGRMGMEKIGLGDKFKALDILENRPDLVDRAVKTAEVIGGEIKNDLGSYDRIKYTIATDPVKFLGYISMLAAPASAVTKGGVSTTLGRIATVTDPLSATLKAGEMGVNAMRAAPAASVAATEAAKSRVMGAIEPFYAPERVAVNRLMEVAEPQNMLTALRQTQATPVTPGAPPLSLSARMVEAGQPSLPIAALETGLAKTSPEVAQELVTIQQQRIAAITEQLNRVENQIQTQAGALRPEAAVELRQVRDTLMRELADERQALANTAQGVARPLPSVSQRETGEQIQTRGRALETELREKVVQPAYARAFEAAGTEPIDVSRTVSKAARLSGGLEALFDASTVPEPIRKALQIEGKTTPGDWVPLGPRGGYQAPGEVGPPTLSLQDFDEFRKALNREYAAASQAAKAGGGSDARVRASNVKSIIDQLDADLAKSNVPREAIELYDAAKATVSEQQVPRFRTGETGKMLSRGTLNMPGTLPSQQVAAFLKTEESAAQFARTFQNDPAAARAMQQGVLDLYRRTVVDPTTRTVDPKKAAAFEQKYARQLDTLENAGANIRATMAEVRGDALRVQRGIETLEAEAAKFSKAKDAAAIVDQALKSPMDMKFVRDKLTSEAREALTGEVIGRATTFIEKGDAPGALKYLTTNEKSIKAALGKDGRKIYDELLGLARLQDEVNTVAAGVPKTDLVTPVKLSRAFTKQELTDLKVAVDDLKRMRAVEEAGTPSDVSVKKLATEQAAKEGVSVEQLPQYFSFVYTTAKNLLGKLTDRTNRRTVAAMMDFMHRDPDKLIPLLEAAINAPKAAPAAKRAPIKFPDVYPPGLGPAITLEQESRNKMRNQPNRNSMAR